MGLLDFFKTEEETQKYSELHNKIKEEYPELDEKSLILTGCMAGLMARVAYVDFDLDPKELEQMPLLMDKCELPKEIDSKNLVKIAVDHIEQMAGLENHLYVHPLRDLLSKDDRFKLVRSLFCLAASDGSVDGVEAEEIRTIVKGLELSNQHYLAARAEVSEFLKALH